MVKKFSKVLSVLTVIALLVTLGAGAALAQTVTSAIMPMPSGQWCGAH